MKHNKRYGNSAKRVFDSILSTADPDNTTNFAVHEVSYIGPICY